MISFGANIDPLPNIQRGLALLHEQLPIAIISAVYRSAPVGLLEQPDFLNGAVRLHPISQDTLTPMQLRTLLRQIELTCGRHRDPSIPRNGPRTLDLDVAAMGQLVVDQPEWQLPDPDISQRPFLALPLAEVAPEWHHPLLGVPMLTIASRFHPASEAITIDPAATVILRSAWSNDSC
ncbi:MAG: 2-amino-4-hydroxy-6-hydroxymethyldihydropteridine diphosphokinase [Magnetococcales bacterium]|nr:2-amino-4-hydroxy-6-hydroxymethyldihydropteridine diphosphokinase [Magnetococcales bacterium]